MLDSNNSLTMPPRAWETKVEVSDDPDPWDAEDLKPVLVTVVSEVDSEASSASQPGPSHKKRRKTAGVDGDKQYPWRNVHQETLAEFWLNHPIFYDKTQQHFKNKAMKLQLMQDLIEEHREEWEKIHSPMPTNNQLEAHLRNMRTRFVKLMKRKAFSPEVRWSYTDQKIYERYQFLCPHIRCSRTNAAYNFQGMQPVGEMEDDEDDDDDDQSEQGSQQPSTSHSQHKGKGKRKKPPNSPPLSPVQDIQDMSELEIFQQAKNLISNIRAPSLSQHERKVRDFCRYLESELLQIPESLWDDCSFTVMNTIRGFKQLDHKLM
uniref:MADF domain-containing protein n=2 Tax=Nothobranchius korthausae TaxID=1143690 RepID=A0A1A8F510_9TELE